MTLDFTHKPPDNYSYEFEEFKKDVIAIWIRDHRKYVYNGGNKVRCMWGFYHTKKKSYYSPVNSKTIGSKVDLEETSPYTSIKIKLNPLEQAFL
jgi:hypothetical protein